MGHFETLENAPSGFLCTSICTTLDGGDHVAISLVATVNLLKKVKEAKRGDKYSVGGTVIGVVSEDSVGAENGLYENLVLENATIAKK